MSILSTLLRGGAPLSGFSAYPLPSEEEAEMLAMVTASVARLREDRLDGSAIDKTGRIPDDVRQAAAELGLFGLPFPEQFGGMELGQRAYLQVFATLAEEDSALCALLGGHLTLVGKGLLLFATEEQLQRWLPGMAAGKTIGSFALTEAEAGSDFRSLHTVADPVENGYLLTGSKMWITNGGDAGLFLAFARVRGAEPGDLTAFLVDADSDGIQVGPPEDKMGLRGSSTTPVDFEEVFVPVGDRLGEEGDGFRIAVEILNRGRIGWSGACEGSGRRLLREASDHARQRIQYGQPIAEFGMVQELLADSAADLVTIEALNDLGGGLVDSGEEELVVEAAAIKIFATEAVGRIADRCLQVAGGNGFSREYIYERMARDARVARIFEGTNQVLSMLIGLHAPRDLDTHIPWEVTVETDGWEDALASLQQDSLALRTDLEAIVARSGKAYRQAQSDHRRIASRALSLIARTALLGRSLAQPSWADPALVRYALALRERECASAAQESAEPLDDRMAAAYAALAGTA